MKIKLCLVLVFFFSPIVYSQTIPPSAWGLIALGEQIEAEERRKKIYIGLAIGALIAGGWYLRWRNINLTRCPYCNENIRKNAIACKHCSKDLTPSSDQ